MLRRQWAGRVCTPAVLQGSLDATGSGVFHQQHRPFWPSHTVSPPVLSFALLRLLYSQAIVYKELLAKNMLLRIDSNFKETTTAHCSVPMLTRLSNEAGPSH